MAYYEQRSGKEALEARVGAAGVYLVTVRLMTPSKQNRTGHLNLNLRYLTQQ